MSLVCSPTASRDWRADRIPVVPCTCAMYGGGAFGWIYLYFLLSGLVSNWCLLAEELN